MGGEPVLSLGARDTCKVADHAAYVGEQTARQARAYLYYSSNVKPSFKTTCQWEILPFST